MRHKNAYSNVYSYIMNNGLIHTDLYFFAGGTLIFLHHKIFDPLSMSSSATSDMGCPGCFYNTTDPWDQGSDDIFVSFAQRRRFERSVGHIVAPAFVIMNSFSLLANIVILVVLFRRGARSRTAVIIINLGFNDILLLCIGTPWKLVAYVMDSWHIGVVMCKLTVYSMMSTLHVEVYTLLLLASLRYLAISKPLNAAVFLTNVRVYILIGVVWTSAILINIPGARFAAVVPLTYDNETYLLCVRMPVRSTSLAEQVYGKCHFFATYTVPLVVIFALLGVSIKKLNSTNSYISGRTTTTDNRKRKRAVYRLVALTVTYAVCVLPVNMVFISRFIIGGRAMHTEAFVIWEICAVFIAFFKCSIHPLLYNCMAEDFRNDVIKLLKRQNTSNSSYYSKKANSDIGSGQNVKDYLDSPVIVAKQDRH